jgi:inosine/xanthosine triphosphatase
MMAAVGSTNPVKLSAAKAVLQRIYGDCIEVLAVPVDPGVPNQPWGDSETRRGAINRAVAAQASSGAILGLGLEGGILEVSDGEDAGELYTSAWCAVIDTSGTLGVAGGANMLLPPDVVTALRSGDELGSAVDKLAGQHDTRSHQGAIGVMCQGWTDRQRAFEQVLTLAFARLLSAHYYAKGSKG